MAIGLWLFLCFGIICHAQYKVAVRLMDANAHEPLAAATVKLAGKTAITDTTGLVLFNSIPAGKHVLEIRSIGYKEFSNEYNFPLPGDSLLITLEADAENMNEVVVSSTRSTRTIRNIPTRVEFIGGEELEEKGNMKPGDIRMMLSESTGIQTQQVSATSANSSIRIQGLDGRYTQLLKDGFPLYSGFSNGLGLLQTPPLDLKQVEIIKGASSTLYGGGAIAGLVNLISKTPKQERDLRFMVNGTSAGGLDLNGFYGQRFGKTGVTIYAARNSSKPYDPSSTGFTAIPKTERYVFNPKMFFYFNPKTSLSVGVNTAFETREGGDIQYIKGHGDSLHSYYENNKSQRVSTQLSLDHKFNEHSAFNFKNAINHFGRTITTPGYTFDGTQWSSYSEGTYSRTGQKSDWIIGLNYYTDNFQEHPKDSFPKRDYNLQTVGMFVQQSWNATKWLNTEVGLRGDYVTNYGFVLLPRVAALFKFSPKLTSRIGGGFGYTTPTIFTEETERMQYKGVLPVSSATNELEKSYGINADINYRTTIGDGLKLSFNQLFFITRINHPLTLDTLGTNVYKLQNASGYLNSRGWETNVKLTYGDFSLFIGYTFTDAWLHTEQGKIPNPLTAKHKLNNVLIYEVEDKFKIGLEAYYTGSQPLNDGKTGQSYWTCGAMAEKMWEKFSVFVNFENITDTRQTRFDTIYTGPSTDPVFRDIYAPLDGFIVNGGIKLRL